VATEYYASSVTLTPDVIYSFKVAARNSVGLSLLSTSVSIRAARVPDAPINLANEAAVTTAYQIGLSWDDGVYDGGSPIIDFMLNYKDEFSGVYTVYQNDIVANTITVTGLTPGVTYSFFIQSRNLVGYSAYSSTIEVLAAQIPDAPTSLANVASVTLAN
jgi:hypothetical protein